MLIYASRASPKAPKRRSRAGKFFQKARDPEKIKYGSPIIAAPPPRTGCIRCKEKKKKCHEQRPRCDRCIERSLDCEYEEVKPRKRRRSSALRQELEAKYFTTGDAYEKTYLPEQQAWEDAQYFASEAFDVEEIVRSEPLPQSSGTVVQSRSQYPDLSMIAPSPIASPLLQFTTPSYFEFSERRNRRALIDHFCNVLSHLIVFKEDTGNPFRQLLLPLSLSASSSPILNAIYALSSAHLEYGGVENEERSLDFHSRALQGLAKLIDQNEKANRDEILGAIMLLVYYEVLVQRGTESIVNSHLRGAMMIMESQPGNSNPTSIFLERAFRFYDVITALSLGTSPVSPATNSNPVYPQMPTANCSPMSNVDTLLGASTTLWPIIHRLSDLLAAQEELRQAEQSDNSSKANILRSEFESTASAIELALTNWCPEFFTFENRSMLADHLLLQSNHEIVPTGLFDSALSGSSCPTESDPCLQSIMSNAEAYRQASLIYLYRYIHLMPTTSPLVQKHTKLALAACTRVVEWKGPMSALLWPLFISSCEAMEEVDRNMATDAFTGVGKRQGMTNIGRAWEVVNEVWKRVDECTESFEDGRILARQICADRGFSIVFG